MTYLDGFVAAVPTANRQTYIEHAKQTSALFKEWGALRVLESWGHEVPQGKQTDFLKAVAAKPDETVVLSFVEWPDKATRDAAWKKMEEDPRMQVMEMPFDGARMIFGGFETILSV